MTTTDGGTNAAYGFNFQFVTTAEYFLRYLRENLDKVGTIALHIESASLGASQQHDDIVDFAIEVDEAIDIRAQVKSSRVGRELIPSEAKEVFEKLNDGKVPNVRLNTNRPLSPKLREACRVAGEDGQIIEYAANEGENLRPGSETITVDSRTIGELTDSVVELVRQFRAENGKSQGRVSCRIVAVVLLHKIFSAAAGEAKRRLTALEVIEAMSMPDREIAEAAGAFDWGVPVAGIPTFQATVPRLTLLEQLNTTLQQRMQDPDGRIPSVAILAGRTGNGKSALAADFCHIKHNGYSEIMWIDSRTPSITAARVRSLTHDLTGETFGEGADASADFVGALAAHPGPWLVVFDNAPSMLALQKYIPTTGNGSVVITTTNSTGSWFSGAQMLPVGEFSPEEAIACFANYADLPDGYDKDLVGEIVSRLGLIPLAVSMAGVYFRNAEGTLNDLSNSYFEKLDALDDMRAIPAGFDRTAFQAIKLAVKNLGQGLVSADERRQAEAVLYHGALLAPELLPLNFIISSTPNSRNIDLSKLPGPTVVDQQVSRSVISTLRTQSIAQRAMNLDASGNQNAASETIAIHPLVHEILRLTYLEAVPPGVLQEQALMIMYNLLGWIDGMRNAFEFFAVDQLLLHATSLLELLDSQEPLTSLSERHRRNFGYCRAMLMLEIGRCYLARGDMTGSIEMSKAAVDSMDLLPKTPVTEFLMLQALSSVLVDLSSAGESVGYVAPFAQMNLALLLSVDLDNSTETFRGFIFETAKLVRTHLRNRDEYTANASIQIVIDELNKLIERDASGAVSAHDLMDQVNGFISSGQYREALIMMPALEQDANEYDKITMRCLRVYLEVYAGEFESAESGIAELLSLTLQRSYLSGPLGTGLGKVYQALIANADSLPSTLSAQIPKVKDRTLQLWEEVKQQSSR